MPQCLQKYLRSFFYHDITTFNVANLEMFWVNTFAHELPVLFHRGENKRAAEEIHSIPSLKLSKHEIDSTRHFSVNWAGHDSKRCAVTKVFFTLKGRTDIT